MASAQLEDSSQQETGASLPNGPGNTETNGVDQVPELQFESSQRHDIHQRLGTVSSQATSAQHRAGPASLSGVLAAQVNSADWAPHRGLEGADQRFAHTHEPESYDDPTAECVRKHNLLALDGGGIRGFWTLLLLRHLMRSIAAVEERRSQVASSFDVAPPLVGPYFPSADSEDSIAGLRQKRTAPPEERYLPCHYFDYIGGSSTGALIAIMLGRLRLTVADCLNEYERLAGMVFGDPRILCEMNLGVAPFLKRTKYSAKGLKQALQDVLRNWQARNPQISGRFPLAPDLCKVYVTVRKQKGPVEKTELLRTYDHEKRHAKFRRPTGMSGSVNPVPATPAGFAPMQARSTGFSNFSTGVVSNLSGHGSRVRHISYGVATDWDITRIARAATAAELILPSVNVTEDGENARYSDGGFSSANNPTWEGIEDIRERWGNHALGTVVSVGTARSSSGSPSMVFPLAGRAKKWVDRMTDPEENHRRVKDESKRTPRFDYFRFNATDEHALKVPLDEWKPRGSKIREAAGVGAKTREIIEAKFNGWIAQSSDVREKLEAAAWALCQERRLRSQRGDWERFAKCVDYGCRVQACPVLSRFASKDEFRQHLTVAHPFTSGPSVENEILKCRRVWQEKPACVP